MIFYETALNVLAKDAAELAPLTERTYFWNLKKFEDFAPGVDCGDVTAELVLDYKLHLQKRGDKPATVAKALSVLRIFTNKLLERGLLPENPFDKVKIGRVYSQRGFLTTRELKKLYLGYMDLRTTLTETEQEVMRVFLFSCFTGLRYGDLKSLDASEIFDWKIRKQTHKTGEAVYVPIPLQARLLLPKLTGGPVFRVVENSHFNRSLRSAAQKLGCSKRLHCHLARHTFATTCITLGIPLPATSKLLGHRNLDTTLIYAKYVDTFLDKEMRKFARL